MKREFSQQILKNLSSIHFHENPSNWSRVVTCWQMDRHAEANIRFSNFMKAPKNDRILTSMLTYEDVPWRKTRFLYHRESQVVDCVWNVTAHAQKPYFVFRLNGRVHLIRQGRQFSRLLAAELCASVVVMLDTPRSEVVWRVLSTHSIRQFPLHFPPPVRHRVPSHFNWTLPTAFSHHVPRVTIFWVSVIGCLKFCNGWSEETRHLIYVFASHPEKCTGLSLILKTAFGKNTSIPYRRAAVMEMSGNRDVIVILQLPRSPDFAPCNSSNVQKFSRRYVTADSTYPWNSGIISVLNEISEG